MSSWRSHVFVFVCTMLVTVAVIVFVGACGGMLEGERSVDDGDRHPFITDGTTDSGHAAVGYIKTPTGTGQFYICTGTLVGARDVLTAGHCVHPGAQTTIELNGQAYEVASATVHPQFAQSQQGFEKVFKQSGGASKTLKLPAIYDLAVMHLKSSVSNVAPSPICSTTPASGWQVTLVGFGKIQDDQPASAGTKRVGVNTVWGVSDQSFNVEGSGSGTSNFCGGDSGGPTFARAGSGEGLVGVHSITSTPDCRVTGIDMRVDPFLDWIKKSVQGTDVKTVSCSGDGGGGGGSGPAPTPNPGPSPQCQDSTSQCASWAAAGYCSIDPIEQLCCASCEGSGPAPAPTCKDFNATACADLASRGFCSTGWVKTDLCCASCAGK